MSMNVAKTEQRTLLLARASVARRLVKEGVLDGPIALHLAVWPTAAILAQEQRCPANTLPFRAPSWRNETAA
jgi:hypothetical protein